MKAVFRWLLWPVLATGILPLGGRSCPLEIPIYKFTQRWSLLSQILMETQWRGVLGMTEWHSAMGTLGSRLWVNICRLLCHNYGAVTTFRHKFIQSSQSLVWWVSSPSSLFPFCRDWSRVVTQRVWDPSLLLNHWTLLSFSWDLSLLPFLIGLRTCNSCRTNKL